MTEAEWLVCDDTPPMWLFVVSEPFSARKVRLFGVAYCRLLRQSADFRNAVEFESAAELVADGLLSIEEARASVRSEWGDRFFQGLLADDLDSGSAFHGGVRRILALSALQPLDDAGNQLPTVPDLFREVFGNPFRPVTFSPDWRTDTATTLARQMYESRGFSAMPILADALQDAGCENEDILDHCRDPGPHVRGCWVLDLVLGKE
jgi:hypothetical protein